MVKDVSLIVRHFSLKHLHSMFNQTVFTSCLSALSQLQVITLKSLNTIFGGFDLLESCQNAI